MFLLPCLPGSKTRKIPYPTKNPFTWLFLLVSCPNYTYEVRVCCWGWWSHVDGQLLLHLNLEHLGTEQLWPLGAGKGVRLGLHCSGRVGGNFIL